MCVFVRLVLHGGFRVWCRVVIVVLSHRRRLEGVIRRPSRRQTVLVLVLPVLGRKWREREFRRRIRPVVLEPNNVVRWNLPIEPE